jgi:hypothetical protein
MDQSLRLVLDSASRSGERVAPVVITGPDSGPTARGAPVLARTAERGFYRAHCAAQYSDGKFNTLDSERTRGFAWLVCVFRICGPSHAAEEAAYCSAPTARAKRRRHFVR